MPIYEFQCPSCKKIIERFCVIGTKTRRSLCGSTGKDVVMKRVLSPTPTNFRFADTKRGR